MAAGPVKQHPDTAGREAEKLRDLGMSPLFDMGEPEQLALPFAECGEGGRGAPGKRVRRLRGDRLGGLLERGRPLARSPAGRVPDQVLRDPEQVGAPLVPGERRAERQIVS